MGSKNSEHERSLRILTWDIEATSLNADFGYMLCFGYRWLGDEKTHVLSVTDYAEFEEDVTNDRRIVEDARAILASANVWVTWYGKRFDVPFIRSRLLNHKLPPLPESRHYDGWETARKKLRLHSNRLASVSAFLGVEEKTPLSGPIWVRAAAGHPSSIDYVKAHCRQDVVVLEQVYRRLRPIATTHPNLGMFVPALGRPRTKAEIEDEGTRPADRPPCPACGLRKLRRAGEQVGITVAYARYVCGSCGAYCRGKSRMRGHTEVR